VLTLSLNKSIQGARLHPRTGAPTTDAEDTIPFGAIIEYAGRDRDFDKYKYMGDMYRSRHDIFVSATNYALIEAKMRAVEAVAEEEEPEPVASAAAPVTAAAAKLMFEAVPSNVAGLKRAQVPGGWLVTLGSGAIAFYPDPDHEWDGHSAE
jgi:hypothetical protein